MALLFRAGCMLAVLCLVTAQTNEELDHLISELFNDPEENPTTKDPPSTGEGINQTSSTTGDRESVDGTGNCTCVPYYLCKEHPVSVDSDLRIISPDPCENFFEVCCVSADIVESKPESDGTTQNLDHLISQLFTETKETATTNLTSSNTGDATSNCTCVPYYTCKPNPTDRTSDKTCENFFEVCCVSGDIVELKPESDQPVQN